MEGNALFRQLKDAWQRVSDKLAGRAVALDAEDLAAGGATLTPLVDIFESDDEILVRADVPGATPKTTHMHLSDRGDLSFRVERDVDDWYRAFRLPDFVDGEKISSSVRDGVLTIHIPKTRGAVLQVPVVAA